MIDGNELVKCLNDALNQDDLVRETAVEKILEYESNNLIELISTTAQIILIDNFSIQTYQYAYVIINRAFSPNSEISFRDIYSVWSTVSTEIQAMVQSAIFRGLMFDLPSIYQLAAHCFALIFNIDPEHCMPMLEQLQLLLIEENYPLCTRFGALKTYQEICESGIIPKIIDQPGVNDTMKSVIDLLFQFLQNPTDFPLNFVVDVIKTMNAFMTQVSSQFRPSEVINPICEVLIKIIQLSNDEQIYTSIHMILLTYSNTFYEHPNLPIRTIFEIGTYGLKSVYNTCVSIAFDFWNEFIKFEKSILKFNQSIYNYDNERKKILGQSESYKCKKKLKNFVGFSQNILLELLPYIFIHIQNINPEDVTYDENEYYSPYLSAYVTLKLLYSMNHEAVYNEVIPFWNDHCILNWTECLSLVLIVSAMCDSSREEPIINFMNEHGKVVLLLAPQFKVERLTICALNTMIHVINSYSIFINDDDLPVILQLLFECTNDEESICTKALYVLASICDKMPINSTDSPIFRNMDLLLSIPTNAINREDSFSTTIAHNSCLFYIFFIAHCPLSQLELIKSLVGTFSTYLSSECIPMILISLDVISASFKRFALFFTEQEAQHIGEIVYKLITTNSAALYESAILAFMHIANSLCGKIFSFANLDFIPNALASDSPSVITNVICLLGRLFKFLGDQGPPFIETYSIIVECMENPKFTPDFFILIGYALPDILLSQQPENIPDEIRDVTYNFILRLAHTQLDLNNENDLETGHQIYEVVFDGIAAIIQITDRIEFLTPKLKTIIQFAQKYSTFPFYNDKTLYSFCKYISAIVDAFPKKYNMIVHKEDLFRLVFWTIASDNIEYVNYAKSVFFKYRNY